MVFNTDQSDVFQPYIEVGIRTQKNLKQQTTPQSPAWDARVYEASKQETADVAKVT